MNDFWFLKSHRDSMLVAKIVTNKSKSRRDDTGNGVFDAIPTGF